MPLPELASNISFALQQCKFEIQNTASLRGRAIDFLAENAFVASMHGKWRTLFLLSLAVLLAMAVWFSASAVVPLLTVAWK